MEVKAKDQIHVSSVRASAIGKDEVFEVSDAEGKQLIERGLVTKVAAAKKPAAKPAAKKPAAKKAAAPKNKMKAAPANKAR